VEVIIKFSKKLHLNIRKTYWICLGVLQLALFPIFRYFFLNNFLREFENVSNVFGANSLINVLFRYQITLFLFSFALWIIFPDKWFKNLSLPYKVLWIMVFFLAIISVGSISNFSTLYVHNTIVFYLYVLPIIFFVICLISAIGSKLIVTNLLVFITMVILLEASFSFIPKEKNSLYVTGKTLDNKALLIRNKILGYTPRPNSEAYVKQLYKGELSYEAIYSFDNYSRRITPVSKSKKPRFILFFGGSRTFGEGVNNNETIPYFVSKKMPNYYPYSYSYSAWGPNQFLAILKERKLEIEIPQKQGIAIFFMIESHINRAVGTYMPVTKYFNGYFPYFRQLKNGEITRHKMFVNGRPLKQFFYVLFSKSEVVNYFIKGDTIRQKDYEFTTQIIAEIKREMLRKFKLERFVVVYHPGNYKLKNMSKLLKKNDIEVIDLLDLFDKNDSEFIHNEADTHLNSRGNSVISKEIFRQLMK
jgi:hypothetical protein